MRDPKINDFKKEEGNEKKNAPQFQAFLQEVVAPEIERISADTLKLIINLQLIDAQGNSLPSRPYAIWIDDQKIKESLTDERGKINVKENINIKAEVVEINIGNSGVVYAEKIRNMEKKEGEYDKARKKKIYSLQPASDKKDNFNEDLNKTNPQELKLINKVNAYLRETFTEFVKYLYLRTKNDSGSTIKLFVENFINLKKEKIENLRKGNNKYIRDAENLINEEKKKIEKYTNNFELTTFKEFETISFNGKYEDNDNQYKDPEDSIYHLRFDNYDFLNFYNLTKTDFLTLIYLKPIEFLDIINNKSKSEQAQKIANMIQYDLIQFSKQKLKLYKESLNNEKENNQLNTTIDYLKHYLDENINNLSNKKKHDYYLEQVQKWTDVLEHNDLRDHKNEFFKDMKDAFKDCLIVRMAIINEFTTSSFAPYFEKIPSETIKYSQNLRTIFSDFILLNEKEKYISTDISEKWVDILENLDLHPFVPDFLEDIKNIDPLKRLDFVNRIQAVLNK